MVGAAGGRHDAEANLLAIWDVTRHPRRCTEGRRQQRWSGCAVWSAICSGGEQWQEVLIGDGCLVCGVWCGCRTRWMLCGAEL